MIKEFAVEPELLDNWRDLRYFVDNFGVSRGRLISRFPRRWKRLVLEAVHRSVSGDRERKKTEEAIRLLDDRLLPRVHEWDPHQEWLPNAVREHGERPFAAILARRNPNRHPDVLEGDDLGPPDDPRWAAETQRTIRRNASEIAGCVAVLIGASQEVVVVDPYLSPQVRRFQEPLREMLRCLSSKRVPLSRIRCEIHTGDRIEESEFRRQCETHLPRLVPKGVRVRVVRWPQGDLHNRYVLTNLGGAMFGTGLDEVGAKGSKEDTVVLLEVEQHRIEWERHQGVDVFCEIDGASP